MGERRNMLKFNWKIACCQGLLASVWLVQISHAELIDHSSNKANNNGQSFNVALPKTEADYIERECRGYEGLGQQAAQFRQTGVSQEKALAFAKYTNEKHQNMRPDRANDIQLIHNVFVLIIEDAYAQPIYPTQAEKQKEIQYRGNRAYSLCKEALPLGMAKAKANTNAPVNTTSVTNTPATVSNKGVKTIAPANKLPFIGTKVFKFTGGASDEEEITIKKDGTTIVKFVGKNGSFIEYKGKYQNPLPIDHGESYYLIRGNTIEMLDKNKKLMTDCEAVYLGSSVCRSELSD